MNRLLWRSIAWLFALAILASSARAARGQSPSDDERTLHRAGLSPDGPSLLAVVRKHTLTAEKRRTIGSLIARLGDASFLVRENASRELFALGGITLPQLQEASKNNDLEIARRVKQLIERIEREPAHHLPVAVLRLLAVRKPAGVVAALLAYLPYAEDETWSEEVRASLTVLARRNGKPDLDLVRALVDPQPLMRFTAAEALAKGGGMEGRAAVRKLLKDDVPLVRLRVALALTMAKEREAIPVLIDLLAVLPSESCGEVESVLYQLAGDSAPKTPVVMEPTDRKKCRDAWAVWWKVNAARVDFDRLTEHPSLGFTLICDNGGSRVYEIDHHGKQRWSIDNLNNPLDAVVLPGNRVLIAESNDHRVSERDFKGTILWQKDIDSPVGVQHLLNGNIFIAGYYQLLEVDRAGKEVYSIKNMPRIDAAYRSRKGHIVCLTQAGQCVLLDTTGKHLKHFASIHNKNLGVLDLLPNGHVLVVRRQDNNIVQLDSAGKPRRQLKISGVTTAMALPNGHILATASQPSQRVIELDREGKVIWEYKGSGAIYRARRR